MPSSVLHDQIPHSLLFPYQPLYFLPPRVFGCTCFVHFLTPRQDKLSAKATKCIFLGYSRLQKGYRCYYPQTYRYFLSTDVTLFEDSPFFSSSESLPVTKVLPLPIISPPIFDDVPSRPLQGEPLGDLGRYRRLVGKLNYFTITKPNISFLVSVVSQFLQSPCDSHWDAVIRILRHIKSTPGQGVLYDNRGHTQVVGYTDADWAGSPTDRRSTSGYCVFIGGNLISWKRNRGYSRNKCRVG